MSVSTFRALHCGTTFEGAEGAKALEAHMKDHRATASRRGQYLTLSAQPSHKAQPWKAPKAPTDTRKLTEVLAKAEKDGSWPGPHVLDWTTDEKTVHVSELRAGDVFIYGRVYIVNGIEGDTLDLTAKKDRNYPEKSAKLTRAQILSKTETVALIRRAA